MERESEGEIVVVVFSSLFLVAERKNCALFRPGFGFLWMRALCRFYFLVLEKESAGNKENRGKSRSNVDDDGDPFAMPEETARGHSLSHGQLWPVRVCAARQGSGFYRCTGPHPVAVYR